jgi:uncharacterized protein
MHKIIININGNGKGFFALEVRNKTIGQIKVDLEGNELKVLDTVVLVNKYLHLIGNLLLQGVVEFARMHELKIITLSKFAQQQFSNNPLLYADVWEKA